MALYLAGLGLVMPQAMAGALTPFPDRAGTASSLMGFVQQTAAAIVAAVIGGYLGRSAWPVAGVVAVMGCLAFLLWAVTRGCVPMSARRLRIAARSGATGTRRCLRHACLLG